MYKKYYNTPIGICRLSSKPGSDLKSLLKQADKLLTLERRILAAMPQQFRSGWRLADYAHGVLALQCDNAAIATRLRLQQAGFLNSLRNEPTLQRLERITVTVRPKHYKPDITRKARPISNVAKSQLLEMAKDVEDDALRGALQRLGGAKDKPGIRS